MNASLLLVVTLAISGGPGAGPPRHHVDDKKSTKKPPGRRPALSTRWRRAYPAIEDPAARALLGRALRAARPRLGSPRTPVRDVALRLSHPRPGRSALRRGFRLTEINDLGRGAFTIYLSVPPGDPAFEGQLVHEALHLLEPRLRDVYFEGLITLVSEKIFAELGLDWRPWKDHFARDGDPLYARAFEMMKELEEIAGERAVLTLLDFTARHDAAEAGAPYDTLRIDVDRWIVSLPAAARSGVRAAIMRHFSRIEAIRSRKHPDCAFARPSPAAQPEARSRSE